MNQEIDLAKAKLYLTYLQLAVTEFENANGVKIKRERRADGTFGTGSPSKSNAIKDELTEFAEVWGDTIKLIKKDIGKAVEQATNFKTWIDKELSDPGALDRTLSKKIEELFSFNETSDNPLSKVLFLRDPKRFKELNKQSNIDEILSKKEDVAILKHLKIDPNQLKKAIDKQKGSGRPIQELMVYLKDEILGFNPGKIIKNINEIKEKAEKEGRGKDAITTICRTLYHELITEKYEIENQIKTMMGSGYSIERRTSEMINAYKQNDKSGVKWRKLIIKAELELGSYVDDIQKSPSNSKEINKNYQALMKKMEKKTGKLEVVKVSSEYPLGLGIAGWMQTYWDSIKEKEMPESSPEDAEIMFDVTTKILEGLQKIIGSDLKIVVEPAGQDVSMEYFPSGWGLMRLRSMEILTRYYHGDGGTKREGDLENEDPSTMSIRNEDDKEIVWHESGHYYEHTTGLAPASADFIKTRTKEFTLTHDFLSKLGLLKKIEQNTANLGTLEPLESGFFNDYTGRIYYVSSLDKTTRATEVISMGLESLSDPEKLKRVSTKDREHILYTMGAIMYEGK
jgi:hypothetical protein